MRYAKFSKIASLRREAPSDVRPFGQVRECGQSDAAICACPLQMPGALDRNWRASKRGSRDRSARDESRRYYWNGNDSWGCAGDIETNQFGSDFWSAHERSSFLFKQSVRWHRLEVECVLWNHGLDDVHHEMRPVWHYCRDVYLGDDLERGKLSSRYGNLFGTLGVNILSHVTIGRNLLIQHTFAVLARGVEDPQERPHRKPHFECSNTQRLGTGRRDKLLSCFVSGFEDKAYLAFPS